MHFKFLLFTPILSINNNIGVNDLNDNEESYVTIEKKITLTDYKNHLLSKVDNSFKEGFFIKNAARITLIAGILFLSLSFFNVYLLIVGILFIIAWGYLLFRIYVKKMEKIDELSRKSFETAIFQLKQEEFFIFIKSKFLLDEQKDSNYYKDTLKKLASLDQSSLEYGIAKMKHIEEKHDLKIFPYILTLIGSIVTYYKVFLEKIEGGNNIAISLGMLIYTIFIAIFIARLMDESKEKTTKALYFRSLLESAKAIKKEKEMNIKEQIEQVKKQQECIEQKQIQIEQKFLWIQIENE